MCWKGINREGINRSNDSLAQLQSASYPSSQYVPSSVCGAEMHGWRVGVHIGALGDGRIEREAATACSMEERSPGGGGGVEHAYAGGGGG
jgi:hypothetical protein